MLLLGSLNLICVLLLLIIHVTCCLLQVYDFGKDKRQDFMLMNTGNSLSSILPKVLEL